MENGNEFNDDNGRNNRAVPQSNFEQFYQSNANVTGGQATDVNAILSTMNTVMQQNAVLIQQLLRSQTAEQNIRNYNIMPDFSKSISNFSGEDLSQSKYWLECLESTSVLHKWPEEFLLETARTHLVGAAFSWYQVKKDCIHTWKEFREEFQNTFIHNRNLTSLWTTMNSRQQGSKEDISSYYYEKIKLCKQLGLHFEEIKEQVAIGLTSRELSSMILSKTHLDIDDLYRDLIGYDRMISERRCRQLNLHSRPAESRNSQFI